ncbi:hypothetical protein R50073_05740 [Maricurvus nonylphenolicus]|uniref:hypothetical protein n=1 Tax=Maricurvus nonylphenolicus TaxID=1008307 RepID=UPI0036F2C4C8
MRKALQFSAITLSLSLAASAAWADNHRWNKGPFSFIKQHFQDFKELTGIVEELADAQPDVVDIDEYNFFNNNYDRRLVDQNGHNAPGECDNRLVQARWTDDVLTHNISHSNSVTGAPCGYDLAISYKPISEGEGLAVNVMQVPQIPGFEQTYSPTVQFFPQKVRIGESWGGVYSVEDRFQGNPLNTVTVLRTSTLLSKLDSVTVPAGTFEDCVTVSVREESAGSEGMPTLRALEANTLCRDIGVVRRVLVVSGYDYQLESYLPGE